MTKLFRLLAIALMAAVTITSCSKDDEKDKDDNPDPVKKSEVTLNGKTYALQEKGIIMDYGTDPGGDPSFEYAGTNFDLYLFTEGVEIRYDSDGYPDSTWGDGYILYFESFSSNSSRPADGVYNYHPNPPFPVGTFDYGNYSDPDQKSILEITEGKYTLSTSGSNYTIVFDLKDNGGKKIEGTFIGTFDILD